MLLSVIIVNYNVKYFLEYCLFSVEKAMKNIEGEIFVVDNNSTDGSRDFFENNFPQVKFIWNIKNEGFAKANNMALKMASGDYILFLNPDTIVPEDCFEKCISFIQSKNNSIACGVKMIDGSGKFLKESKRAFPSPLTSLYKLSGLARFFPRSKLFSKYHLGYLDENVNHEVDVLAGAFMIIPKKILDTVGGFDESFFMYGEDIDLSYRIQKAGYKNFYFAESCIIHFKGESTKKGSLNYVKMFYKAMSVFVKKHYGGTSAGLFNFFIQVAIFFRAALSVTARFFRRSKAVDNCLNAEISNAIIAGSREDFNDLSVLFQTCGINKRAVGHILAEVLADPEQKAFSNKMVEIISAKKANEIIFCEGQLSFKKIISILPYIPQQIDIIFFAAKLHSLISSSNKNEAGNFTLKENK
ncbi:glycosyltransferase family 2 protein [Ginsengibacter hankyongi]|uniref:Glycosyltransferase family 2 protein n=1 Tax=Ginsengibacter hankyongi TaxID=2607284 RepID=A0A5J5ILX6_9BACT|nr:glycosyltransferase family 2 protein [Ginsengibacter hankyongi]KAA9042000.1 glycosyltransferase family 2 protein [Ginsengibacter hankyongi]